MKKFKESGFMKDKSQSGIQGDKVVQLLLCRNFVLNIKKNSLKWASLKLILPESTASEIFRAKVLRKTKFKSIKSFWKKIVVPNWLF